MPEQATATCVLDPGLGALSETAGTLLQQRVISATFRTGQRHQMRKMKQMGDFHQQLSLPELQIKHLNTQDGATCTLSGYKLKLGLLTQIYLQTDSGSAEPSRDCNSTVLCLQGSSLSS